MKRPRRIAPTGPFEASAYQDWGWITMTGGGAGVGAGVAGAAVGLVFRLDV